MNMYIQYGRGDDRHRYACGSQSKHDDMPAEGNDQAD
jgi:hypothetical protein